MRFALRASKLHQSPFSFADGFPLFPDHSSDTESQVSVNFCHSGFTQSGDAKVGAPAGDQLLDLEKSDVHRDTPDP